jgi:PhnB protein
MPEPRPDVSIYLIADNAAKALDFYVAGLGAVEVERWIDPDNGKIGHAEFRLGSQRMFLSDGYQSMAGLGVKTPAVLGGTTLSLWLAVDNVEQALARALAAGARPLVPVETMTVDEGRRCRIADPAGYLWTLAGP